MTRALVMLSGQTDDVRPILAAARARFAAGELTVVLRAPQRAALLDLLDGVCVLDDKPQQGRLAFVRALRRETFSHGVVAWTGAWSHWPSKLAFTLARVQEREVATERGTFAWSLGNVVEHLIWRAKAPVHPTGAPPGVPWPLALGLAALRATLGRLLGPIVTLVRTAWRRATS